MKSSILILLCLFFFVKMQAQDDANLFEVVRMTVKPGQEKAFEAAVKTHNTKFHGAGLYSATLHYNINGPYGGQYSWIMGPTNYTAMDNRPGEGAHDDDWDNNVMTLVESISAPTYWSRATKLSHQVDNSAFNKTLIWMYDITPGQGARFSELVGKVKEVYDKKRPDESFGVAWNEFANTKEGMDAVILFSFDKWAFMDRQNAFSKDFEEVHGEGSWHNFLNQFSEVIDGRIDWMRSRVD